MEYNWSPGIIPKLLNRTEAQIFLEWVPPFISLIEANTRVRPKNWVSPQHISYISQLCCCNRQRGDGRRKFDESSWTYVMLY